MPPLPMTPDSQKHGWTPAAVLRSMSIPIRILRNDFRRPNTSRVRPPH